MATIPVVTVRLEPELRERLDRLAKAQRRSRSYVATEAIREYLKVNEW
jgi:predicted transcriptional regulator